MPDLAAALQNAGRSVGAGVSEVGLGAVLLAESLGWVAMGPARGQPVHFRAVVAQAFEIGVRALPIVVLLSLAIGAMVAIQGIYTLRLFGAESKVTIGIAISLTREFSPLITGILVTGRSGSALASRLGTMVINEEISALTVMGINPVRYLVAPPLLAMLVMVPLLTWISDVVGMLGGGVYVTHTLGISMTAYLDDLRAACKVRDILHGLGKSGLFAVLITLVGVVNGLSVTGGAEGIGRVTTRAVVLGIAAIVVTDMLFAYMATHL